MSLIAELKRRNVFRVGVAYAIVAWLLVEVASVVLPTFEAPAWVMQVFTFLVILGFPLTLVIAWAFELTPQGIKPAKEVAPAESIRHLRGRKLDFAIIALLAIAVVYFAVDRFVLEAGSEQGPERARQAGPLAADAEDLAGLLYLDEGHGAQPARARDLAVTTKRARLDGRRVFAASGAAASDDDVVVDIR